MKEKVFDKHSLTSPSLTSDQFEGCRLIKTEITVVQKYPDIFVYIIYFLMTKCVTIMVIKKIKINQNAIMSLMKVLEDSSVQFLHCSQIFFFNCVAIQQVLLCVNTAAATTSNP